MNLDQAIEYLRATMDRYPGSPEHMVPDIVLYNLAIDVLEQAEAVRVVVAGPAPRAGYTNARAALESALDLSFLVADEKHYDFRGAQARVFEIYENSDVRSRAPAGQEFRNQVPTHPEDTVIADATSWDAECAKKGDILRRAWEDFTKDKGRLRGHWSGKDRLAIYEEVSQSIGGDADLPATMDAAYGLLSVSSHPRPRTGARIATQHEDGTTVLSPRPVDKEAPAKIAAMAVKFALRALEIRRHFK